MQTAFDLQQNPRCHTIKQNKKNMALALLQQTSRYFKSFFALK